ncbi:hypothetical protein JMN21_27565, partial [Pseudomonas syringae pv. actinidiae]|nr:hypothetical protein [Pseudomonas syringae pv. actinidiae]
YWLAENSNFIKNLGCRSWVSYFENSTLESDAQNWRRAQVIRDYIDALERKSLSATHGIEHMSYFQWARAKADWLDPLERNVTDLLDEDIKIPY